MFLTAILPLKGVLQLLVIYLKTKNTQATFLSFYIDENRLYSKDGNINWRLRIWQDVIVSSLIMIESFWKWFFK